MLFGENVECLASSFLDLWLNIKRIFYKNFVYSNTLGKTIKNRENLSLKYQLGEISDSFRCQMTFLNHYQPKKKLLYALNKKIRHCKANTLLVSLRI